ncbi:MAG: hypothetical protein KDA53_02625 [Hyphomonas sp.]|nr:hypothetical protein [Hyphomonas sp.]
MMPPTVIDCRRTGTFNRTFTLTYEGQAITLLSYAASPAWDITIGEARYQVVQEGLMRLRWRMRRGSADIMTADEVKPRLEVAIASPSGPLGLERVPVLFVSTIDLVRGQKVVARIAPKAFFSGGIRVSVSEAGLPAETLAFAICLAENMWRSGQSFFRS